MDRTEQLKRVLVTAEAVLAARRDQMLTGAEWDALVEAVAAARASDHSGDERTYSGQLDVWTDACQRAAETALREAGVAFTARGIHRPHYDVEAITASQYAAVLGALEAAGEAGVDWNFPLD